MSTESSLQFATPAAAEDAFYQAFSGRDLATMMSIWADYEQIACIHPMNHLLRGRQAVRLGWMQIFSGDRPMHFEREMLHTAVSDTIATHTLIERIYLHGESRSQQPILATNVYVLGEGGWKMVLHHASPAVLREGPGPGTHEPAMH